MATNFLHAAGTNGFIASPFTLIQGAELDALASGGAVTSAAGGTSGKFNQTNFASAQRGLIYLTTGDAGWTPTAGGCLVGWWLHSHDGGTTFEELISTPSTTVPALPRAPDFIIPVYEGGTALGTTDIKYASGLVLLPWDTVKVVVQNMTGAATGNTTATHATISCAPVADQY